METLSSLLTRMEQCFGFQICIHDVSGVTYLHEALKLEKQQTIHACAYCAAVKTQPACQRACLAQKRLALRRVLKAPEGYCGLCFLGMTEAVRPVILEGRPIVVVFIGGAAREDREMALRRIQIAAPLTGHTTQAVAELFGALVIKADTTHETLRFCADLVADRIARTITSAHLQHALSQSDEKTFDSPTPVSTGRRSWVRHQMVPYLASHYRLPLTLRLLSDLFFMNQHALCRLFKRETGQTIHGFIRQCRIEDACRQLKQTQKPIHLIAEDVGVSDANYFARLFTRQVGMSPSEYRRNGSILC